MLVEGFVSLMALVAACSLLPNDYFAINANPLKFPAFAQAALHPGGGELAALTQAVGETNLVGRTGGAVTLAVGMAKIFGGIPGMHGLMSYWYHFAIMFEALFILTTVDTGTRVARFILQEPVAAILSRVRKRKPASKWALNIGCSAAVSLAWGYLLYNNDIATIWPMIALAVGTTLILTVSRRRVYALTTFLPFLFVLVTTMAGGIESLPGFLKTGPGDPHYKGILNGGLTLTMLLLTVIITVEAVRSWIALLAKAPQPEVQAKAKPAPV
jgi:carbon starvation protein